MKRWLILILGALAAAAGILAATAGAVPITIHGTLGPNPSPDWPKTTGSQTGRVTGNSDTACVANAYPGQPGSPPPAAPYDAYTFHNPSSSSVACVTVTGDDTSVPPPSPAPMQSNAYSPSFNPANIATNWIGQESQKLGDVDPINTPVATYHFNVAANADFVVVVNGIHTSETCNPCTYTLTVDTNQGRPTVVTLLARSSATRTPRGVLLRWRTVSERNELGFNVYREVAGKRVKVNRSVLPSVFGGTARGHAYSFVDRTAPRVGKLRYWIQDVSLNGARAWHGPFVAT
jgi:hypothetical protein